jgi:hypothetical protein
MTDTNLCVLCKNNAEYTMIGYYPPFLCKEHYSKDMIHISDYKCKDDNCNQLPLYGYENSNYPEYCNIHKPNEFYNLCKLKNYKDYLENSKYLKDKYLYNEYLDDRFNFEFYPISYYPCGVLYSEDFKYRPNRRYVWFDELDYKHNHLKFLQNRDLHYVYIRYPIQKLPLYMYKAYVSRSNYYDESDRICATMMGFIFINIFSKFRKYVYPSDSYSGLYLENDKYINSFGPRDDVELEQKRYNFTIECGIKWAKFAYEFKNLDLPFPSDINKYILKPYLTNINLIDNFENINNYLSDNYLDYEWICVCEYWNDTDKKMETKKVQLITKSYTTIGFPIEYKYKYKSAEIMFVLKNDNSKVFLRTQKIKLLNFKTYNFNEYNRYVDFL